MPTYDYQCSACGGFEARRAVSERDEPIACPDCSAASVRVMSAAPRLALMGDGTRRAIATNERAANEPKRPGDYARLKPHASGCGCCGTAAKRGATVTGANGNKAFPSKRPWMISH